MGAKRAEVFTAHQVLKIRRAYPDARIDGPVIRVGRWTMITLGGRLDLPMSEGPAGWYTDGCDEAMTVWTRLSKMLVR